MSYSLDSLDDGHILYFTMHHDFDVSVDMPKYLQECYQLVQNGPDQIIIISDGRELNPSMDIVIEGANAIRSKEARRITEHSKVIKNFTVFDTKIARLAIKGLNSAAFGFFEVSMFETPKDAISRAREILSD